MARVLIIPCDDGGQELARALRADGLAVRGTTTGDHVEAIRAAGAEPYVGDPDRIGTLMDALYGVTIVVWLAPDVPEGRLRMLWEKLVDTGVRGVVHDGPHEETSRTASATWSVPLEFAGDDPHAAVKRLLGV